jgi:hypothetical protein
MVTGACTDYHVDTAKFPQPDRSGCRALCRGFASATNMPMAILNIVLKANHTQMSTESLTHMAAALNIHVSSVRNLGFRLCGELRKYSENLGSVDIKHQSSATVAELFHSFEKLRRPALISIAALHRIQIPDKATIEFLHTQITQHIISGHCSQNSESHHPEFVSDVDVHVPDCTDGHDEWQVNQIDLDLQVHILSALYGSKISQNSLRRILSNLEVNHHDSESVGQLRRKLKGYINDLCKGKNAERIEQHKLEAQMSYHGKLQNIRDSWPQLVPQSLENKLLNCFCQETS